MQIQQRRKKIQKKVQKILKQDNNVQLIQTRINNKETIQNTSHNLIVKNQVHIFSKEHFENFQTTEQNFKRQASLSTISTRSNGNYSQEITQCKKSPITNQLSQQSNTTYDFKEIYQTLLQSEKKWQIKQTQFYNQKQINDKMRVVLVQWLIKVHQTFQMNLQTLFRALLYLERFASLTQINRKEYQLIGSTCLLIAAKFEEIYPPKIKQFVYMCDQAFSKQQFISCEMRVLNTLQYDILNVTPISFIQILEINNLISNILLKEIKNILQEILLNKEIFSKNPRVLLIATIVQASRNINQVVQLEEICSLLDLKFESQEIFHVISFINNNSNHSVL